MFLERRKAVAGNELGGRGSRVWGWGLGGILTANDDAGKPSNELWAGVGVGGLTDLGAGGPRSLSPSGCGCSSLSFDSGLRVLLALFRCQVHEALRSAAELGLLCF